MAQAKNNSSLSTCCFFELHPPQQLGVELYFYFSLISHRGSGCQLMELISAQTPCTIKAPKILRKCSLGLMYGRATGSAGIRKAPIRILIRNKHIYPLFSLFYMLFFPPQLLMACCTVNCNNISSKQREPLPRWRRLEPPLSCTIILGDIAEILSILFIVYSHQSVLQPQSKKLWIHMT